MILQVILFASAWWLGRNNPTPLQVNDDNGVSLAKQISQQYDAETRDSITFALERFMQAVIIIAFYAVYRVIKYFFAEAKERTD